MLDRAPLHGDSILARISEGIGLPMNEPIDRSVRPRISGGNCALNSVFQVAAAGGDERISDASGGSGPHA